MVAREAESVAVERTGGAVATEEVRAGVEAMEAVDVEEAEPVEARMVVPVETEDVEDEEVELEEVESEGAGAAMYPCRTPQCTAHRMCTRCLRKRTSLRTFGNSPLHPQKFQHTRAHALVFEMCTPPRGSPLRIVHECRHTTFRRHERDHTRTCNRHMRIHLETRLNTWLYQSRTNKISADSRFGNSTVATPPRI